MPIYRGVVRNLSWGEGGLAPVGARETSEIHRFHWSSPHPDYASANIEFPQNM